MFLVLTDTYSKCMDIYSMSDIKTETLIDALRLSFATHGLPYIIISYNRPSFTSKEFKNFIHKKWNKTYYNRHQMLQLKGCSNFQISNA